MNILLIDNYDSFTFNLVEEFEKRDNEVKVFRNNASMETLSQSIEEFDPGMVVLSPGPSTPDDAGVCLDLIDEYHDKLPFFGICLGFQCLVEYFGGEIDRCYETFHGKSSKIEHNGKKIFEDIENNFQAGRYHSLYAPNIPDSFTLAASHNDIPMAIWHNEYPIYGVQFHPESILTPLGGKIIENIIRGVKND